MDGGLITLPPFMMNAAAPDGAPPRRINYDSPR